MTKKSADSFIDLLRDFGRGIKDLWEKSILVQSVLTIGLIAVICTIIIIQISGGVPATDVAVPETLLVFAAVIVGYWFKKKDALNDEAMLQKTIGKALQTGELRELLQQLIDELELPDTK